MSPGGTTPSIDARAPDPSGAPAPSRYRTLVPVGRGGMGTVELAVERLPSAVDRSPDAPPERIVALKRLLPDAKARHAEMFLREARLAVLLHHPNVVHVYDFGELDGELFMAMEYVEGEPLSRVISAAREKGAPLDPLLVARLLADVCDGLHAAHELVDETGVALRVVHRDVSPHNIMVAYDGQVKLLDFGVAKIEAEQGLTRTGEVKGKAAYMSPEQAMGDPLDRRSDLYSVGVVLFESLTGRRMWEGTDMDVMRKLALEPTPKLEAYVPDVSPALKTLFERLVARSREDRPATARDVARDLRAIAATAAPELGDALTRLMARLFEGDAQSRRADLERALASVDPLQAEELRKSLVPTLSRSAPAIQPDAPLTSRARPLLLVLAIALALFALAAARWSASSPPPVPVPRPTVPVPGPTVPVPDPPALSPSLAPTLPPNPTPTGIATPSPSPSSAPSASQRKPILRVDPRPPIKIEPKPPASSKPLDVDPHAI